MGWKGNKDRWTFDLNFNQGSFERINCRFLHVTEWLRLEGISTSHLV